MKKKHMIIMVVISILSLFGCESKKAIPIQSMSGSFSIDVENPEELVGDADYVFIGKVEELVNTEYLDPIITEDENGNEITITSPYTNYKVIVEENIKGELDTKNAIIIQKEGGITEDGKAYSIFENDLLPEVGNSYIFNVYAQPDGSNFVSGPNSNIPVVENEKNEVSTYSENIITGDEAVKIYEDAYEHEAETDREHYVSDDDISQ